MKNAMRYAAGVVVLAMAGQAFAQETATATLTQLTNTSPFNYQITLTNTGTTAIGTFWYGWIPGFDYLTSMPTNISAPPGWIDPVVNNGVPTDGYSIEFYNITGANIAAGHKSSAFDFTSPDSLLQLTTNPSTFYGGAEPAGTAFIYAGFPESDRGFQFTVQPAAVPEPASIGLLTLAGAGLLSRRAGRKMGV